jgi:large subunit ribosomal protein L21
MSDAYAVIKTGGKQYRVKEGDVLKVEKLDHEVGDSISFSDVLLTGSGSEITVGSPLVDGASVSAEVLEQMRGKKIQIIKFKRRKHYRRQAGHRQYYTKVRITAIA